MKRFYFNKANPSSISFPKQKYICKTSVAVLMATYNGGLFIKEQIESILDQDSSDWTLYIRDDGSSDNTLEIINDYVSKFPVKIILINSDQLNIGCSNNFYELLFSVSSKYYMFCDQDDIWVNNKISSQLTDIENEERIQLSKAIIIGCDSYVFRDNISNSKDSTWKTNCINRHRLLDYNRCAVQCPIGGAEMIFNNEAKSLLNNNIDNDFTYDHWLLMNVVKKGTVILSDCYLRYYRSHENNVIGPADRGNGKFKNLRGKLRHYMNDYKMLCEIGYGSLIKYAYYKISCMYICKLLKF